MLVSEVALCQGCWLLGCVEKVFPRDDGVVCVVKVQNKSGTYVRHVVKLCLLAAWSGENPQLHHRFSLICS